MTDKSRPVACTLTTADAAGQVSEWVELRSRASETVARPDGVVLRFPAELEEQIVDLATREAACCAFLALTTAIVDDEVVLEISTPTPPARR